MNIHARGSGLLVAEQAAPPREIAELLRRVDRRLTLQPWGDQRYETTVWRVEYVDDLGNRHLVVDWRENPEDNTSRPRPLSSGIVDEAASRQLGSRRSFTDPLEANDRRRAQVDRDDLADTLTAAAEANRLGRRSPMFHRGVGLRMARDKARARGENV